MLPPPSGAASTFQQFLVSQSPHVDTLEFLENLGLNLVVVGLVAFAYVRFGRALSNRSLFARNLVLVSLTTMLIITIVKSSLALSLGLVGALSIIRFRTPIKEPEELTFLFLAISAGLGFGANQRIPVLLGVGFILLVVILMKKRGSAPSAVHLTLSLDGPPGTLLDDAVVVLNRHCSAVSLHRHDERAGSFTSDFFVSFRGFDELNRVRKDLRELNGELVISFLDQRLLS